MKGLMQGSGLVIGKKAPDFTLEDQEGRLVTLSDALKASSVLLVFYPGDFTPVCTKQLCNYRDSMQDFQNMGVQVLGISSNSKESHADFAKKYNLSFPLLSDLDKKLAKTYGCTSLLLFGSVSRAVFIVNQKGVVLYRYVEPTTITRRKADELVGILGDLKTNNLL